MKPKTKFLIFAFVFGLALALSINVALAASASDLQPAATIAYNEPVQINGNLTVNGIAYFPKGVHIGVQGAGGVTFFNGTIVNDTNTDGWDNPVTFGDNVRIDGVLFRGAKMGPGDKMPLKILDDMFIKGVLTGGGSVVIADDLEITPGHTLNLTGATITGTGVVSETNLASNAVTSAKIKDGTIGEGDLASNAVTTAKIKDGTIGEGDLASNAVTTGKIKNGTIVGVDINTSTDMAFRNLNLSGNAAQAIDKGGMVKALAYIEGSASRCSVTRQWSSQGGTITCDYGGIGRYAVTFPPQIKIAGRYFQVTGPNQTSTEASLSTNPADPDKLYITILRLNPDTNTIDWADGEVMITIY